MNTHSKQFQILNEKFAYTYINLNETARKLVTRLEQYKGQRMGLDIETTYKPELKDWNETNKDKIKKKRCPATGLDPHMSRIRLVQIYDPSGMTWILDMFHVDPEIVITILGAHKWVAHNAVFEQSHIRKLSPKLECLDIECSMIQALLIDRAEHSPFEASEEDEDEMEEEEVRVKTQGFGLHALSVTYLNFPLDKQWQADGWDVPELKPEQLAYAAMDAVICKKLHTIFNPMLAMHGMEKISKVSYLMIPIIAEMQGTGLLLDEVAHKKLIAEWTAECEKAKVLTDKYFPGVNLNSPKQLAKWAIQNLPQEIQDWPITKKGAELLKKNIPFYKNDYLSFGRPAISHLRTYPAIAALLDYKKVAKLLSTYGESLRDFINPVTGRIHPGYSLAETRTGRLSSSSPNGQNFPNDPLFRSMFISPSGCSLTIYDLSQIEIRVAAELSRDRVLLRSFEEGLDLHKLIVSRMTGKPENEITKQERKLGKTLNFGAQFGAGAKTLRKQIAYQMGLVLTEEEAYHAKDTYDQLYSGYIAWCNVERSKAEEVGYVRTVLGKKRKLSEGEIYTKSINCPVQGGAAEVLMVSLVFLFRKIRELELQRYIRISATVHDSVMLYALKGYEAKAEELIQDSFGRGMLYVFPKANIKGIANGGSGNNWTETGA